MRDFNVLIASILYKLIVYIVSSDSYIVSSDSFFIVHIFDGSITKGAYRNEKWACNSIRFASNSIS